MVLERPKSIKVRTCILLTFRSVCNQQYEGTGRGHGYYQLLYFWNASPVGDTFIPLARHFCETTFIILRAELHTFQHSGSSARVSVDFLELRPLYPRVVRGWIVRVVICPLKVGRALDRAPGCVLVYLSLVFALLSLLVSRHFRFVFLSPAHFSFRWPIGMRALPFFILACSCHGMVRSTTGPSAVAEENYCAAL